MNELNKSVDKIMNIHYKIATLRTRQELKNIKKTGYNKFADFPYFQLEDFLPTCNMLELELGLTSDFNLKGEEATLVITNINNPTETKLYETTVAEANMKGVLEIQKLGSVHTYLKRYLYLNYLNLTEGDTVDAIDQSKRVAPKSEKPESKIIDAIGSKLYDNPERLQTMLNHYGVENLKDLTKEQSEEALKILSK